MVIWAISVLAFLLLVTISGQAQNEKRFVGSVAAAPAGAPDKIPAHLVNMEKDRYLRQAYVDVFSILSQDNSCSGFYGGPRAATTVLNELITVVKRRELPQEVSLEMTGNVREFRDPYARVSYRLFENALVNTRGSFYHHPIDHWQRLPHEIGSFASGTRSARALILLHELGHMIRGNSGAWLIADDGRDPAQSRENTRRVQKVCLPDLRALQ